MNMRNRHIVALLFLWMAVLSSCGKEDGPINDDDTNGIQHVFFIGLDGWGGYNLDVSKMPFFSTLLDLGVWSMNKQAVIPSGSGQNWTTMFMGAGPDIHGYTEWDSKSPSISYDFQVKNNIFPTIFQVLKEQKEQSEIGVFFQWDNIRFFVDTLSCNKICNVVLEQGHDSITDSIKCYIVEKKPTLCAVVYDDPDHTGHQYGYFSDNYYETLSCLDLCIREIVQATKEAGIYDNAVFIITSDHGGIGYSHGGDSPDELDTPFLMFGKNVKKTGRIENVLMQYDIAPIIANLLVLTIPDLWIGDKHPELLGQ